MFFRTIFKIIACSVLLIISNNNQVFSQANVGTTSSFFQQVNSAAAVGMGNCSINQIDNQSAFYNPGAFGLAHLDKRISLSAPNSTKMAGFDYWRDKSYSIGISIINANYDTTAQSHPILKFNLALAFSRGVFGIENLRYTNYYYPFGDDDDNSSQYYTALDRTNFYTLGVGFDYYFRFGIGLTYKRFKETISFSEIKGGLYDFGVMVELPISKLRKSKSKNTRAKFEFTAFAAYVQANAGPEIQSDSENMSSFSIPRFARLGFSVLAALKLDNEQFISARFAHENEDIIGIEFDSIDKTGYEIGIVRFVYFRWGKINNHNYKNEDRTEGLGLDSDGILFLLNRAGVSCDQGLLGHFKHHININYDWAKLNPGGSTSRTTNYHKLSISLRI